VDRPSPSEKFGIVLALLRHAAAIGAALVAPWLLTQATVHTRALQSTPLLLGFSTIVLFTLLVNLGTGLAASLSTALAFNHFFLAGANFWALETRGVAHSTGVLTAGILVTLMCERQNVTRSRLQRALASLQAQTDALMEAQRGSNSVAWQFEGQKRRFLWAEGGAEIFGRPFAQVAALDSPASLVLAEDRACFEQSMEEAMRTGRAFRVEFRTCWPNGELRWIEARGAAQPGKSELWRGVMVDVTERKNAELALIRSEKLAAIGLLSATVAHEINNPLEAVTNLLYLAALAPELQPQTRRYLAQADEEIARLASIARHTLTFARPGPSSSVIDLGEIAESIAEVFQPRCRSRGGEIRILRRGTARISAPRDELRQIFTNLISNACDALPEAGGGLVEVELSARATTAVVEVRDNGVGISPEHQARVFEPFFTTKEGIGTGIGLWVTRELVEKNGGQIDLRPDVNRPGFPTVFHLEFRVPLA
jgi:signal transduction histidine kinase